MCGELARPPATTGARPRFIPACAGNSPSWSWSPAHPPVHPRVCGELIHPHQFRAFAAGSSPRVRGTRLGGVAPQRLLRFIPACAGNSIRRVRRAGHRAVHPRVCGELAAVVDAQLEMHGSSPRVRGTRGPRKGRARTAPVHPRVCGELYGITAMLSASAGSSPRVRGTLIKAGAVAETRRFIPACAGNSARPAQRRPGRSVHPRVCGELGIVKMPRCSNTGSSPRVRGTRVCAVDVQDGWRFIPACAGNSRSTTAVLVPRTVHPRVCGELRRDAHSRREVAGSSPRVRGTRFGLAVACPRGRFIPACAGNSCSPAATNRRCSVHPRVCGELPSRTSVIETPNGSSPRVRGTPRSGGQKPSGRRFIPACAGNSGALLPPRRLGAGSSPRVRGTRGRPSAPRANARFIPACAGNSSSAPWAPRRPPVHPRVCGELDACDGARVPFFGSSPRVRGTRPRSAPDRAEIRFIPACAGNSPTRPPSAP